MKNLLNPKLLFVINGLPVMLLFVLLAKDYATIETLLDPLNKRLWRDFAIALGVLGSLTCLYAGYLIVVKKPVQLLFGIVSLISYTVFLWVYGHHFEELIPFSIPRWMVSGNTLLYVGAFLMPTLAYSLFVIMVHLTPKERDSKPWKNFLAAILIPVSWYLFIQVLLPLWNATGAYDAEHLFTILLIISTVLFLFFLLRGFYIVFTRKATFSKKYRLLWEIPIAVLFPLLGLAVNNGRMFSGGFSGEDHGFFGDFTNHWFYILAFINGALVCLPDAKNRVYRIIIFLGRCITFSYTVYFFMVFLPFLPLSIPAIVVFGTGFLMLTPLALFALHSIRLNQDFKFLKNYFSSGWILTVASISFLAIPAVITFLYLNDKRQLNNALEYVYKPDYSKSYGINERSLIRTLNTIKAHKEKNASTIYETSIPYLSNFYNWIVLDHLTLSDVKIARLEQIFTGVASGLNETVDIANNSVEISNIDVKSEYDNKTKTWSSWVDLKIVNRTEANFSEYATSFELPDGCWIDDYYLYVGNKKEKGILAEKKSAMWVFSNIRNGNKDPGLVHYLTGNKILFRVFPFGAGETRRTGIRFLHKEPALLNMDHKVIQLGKVVDSSAMTSEVIQSGNAVFIPAAKKALLPKVQRKPYYHFIVDASAGQEKNRKHTVAKINRLLNRSLIDANGSRISFAGTYVETQPLVNNWSEYFDRQNYKGGFFLERALKKALVESYRAKESRFPVFVVISDSMQNAVFDNGLADLKFTFPESDLYYELDNEGRLNAHSMLPGQVDSLLNERPDFANPLPVLRYLSEKDTVAYLPDNGKPSVIIKDAINASSLSDKSQSWLSGLAEQGSWMEMQLHPELTDKQWLPMVQKSFRSKIMTPLTSFIVVENEAQKQALLRKQEAVLNGNPSLDPDEDTVQMSEPGWLVLVLMLMLISFKNKNKILSCLNRK